MIGVALVSVMWLVSWRPIPLDQAAATPVVQGEQAQAAPADEILRLSAPMMEVECFEVDPPCGYSNCTSLGTGYSCWNPDRCCCPGKSCQ